MQLIVLWSPPRSKATTPSKWYHMKTFHRCWQKRRLLMDNHYRPNYSNSTLRNTWTWRSAGTSSPSTSNSDSVAMEKEQSWNIPWIAGTVRSLTRARRRVASFELTFLPPAGKMWTRRARYKESSVFDLHFLFYRHYQRHIDIVVTLTDLHHSQKDCLNLVFDSWQLKLTILMTTVAEALTKLEDAIKSKWNKKW